MFRHDQVFEAVNRTGNRVAMKVIRKSAIKRGKDVEAVKKEVDVLFSMMGANAMLTHTM